MEVDLYCTGDALGTRSGRRVSTRKETWKVGAREGAGTYISAWPLHPHRE
jgi:hypothetical protein